MRPEARDPGYLWDMRRAARELLGFLQGKTLEDLSSDRMLELTVEKELEIIGELARRISDEFKLAHPEIPWSDMIALRNVLVHRYEDVKLEVLWNETLPKLNELDTELTLIIDEALTEQGLTDHP